MRHGVTGRRAPGAARAVVLRVVTAAGLLVALPVLVLWATGTLGDVARWAAAAQHEAQNALARAIRSLRAGEGGALAALLGMAFAYGVFHAAGPGHGKVLIGGYGVARRVRLWPLTTLALVSSLAQATVAVVLVYGGIAAFAWTREQVVRVAEDWMLPASHAGVALIGLWLAVRGVRGMVRVAGHDHGHDHHDHHGHDHVHDAACTHAHAPTPDQVAAITTPREALALVAGIAARPCTGALLLLVLTWQMGIGAAGIAGAYVMGLGTAAITVAVAGLSVWAREGMLAVLAGGRVARALPVLELAAGLAIAVLSGMLFAGRL
ncbi:MAG: nickel/cobalt transporter [Gemmobacter sp.]